MTRTPTRADIAIDVRHAVPGDEEGIAALFDHVYNDGYIDAECTAPALIRPRLAGREDPWVIVVADGAVVGSLMARHDPDIGGYELGRAVIHPDHRGRPETNTAVEMLVGDTMRRPDGEVLFGFVRSERARRKISRAPLQIAWTAATDGMHVVLGEREDHLFGMAFHPGHRVTRVLPRRSILSPGSAVAREVDRLRSAVISGDYPVRIAGGASGRYCHESSHGRVLYSVFERSRAAVVAAVDADTPEGVRRVLWEILDGAAPVRIEHLTVHLLADKVSVIEELRRSDGQRPARRFTACGYRPGWHKNGDARYDCVTLAARTSTQIPNRSDLHARIEGIHRSFPPVTG